MKYAILGRGVWASAVMNCLSRLGRDYIQIKSERVRDGEPWEEYAQRIAHQLQVDADEATIFWVCIPPCLEAYHYMSAILKLRFNLIVEKPVHLTQSQLEVLGEIASRMEVRFFANFQFNYLPKLVELSDCCDDQAHIFSSAFHSSKTSRHGVLARRNLGVHMYSIYINHFKHTIFGAVDSSYGCTDQRYVALRKGAHMVRYDFTNEQVDILALFIVDCENWVQGSGRYLMDINHVKAVLSMMSN